METKLCSKCNIEKILLDENFAKYKGKWRAECRSCGRQVCREYKARNRQQISEYNKAYKSSNKQSVSEYNKKYYHDNIEKMQEKNLKTHERLRETNPAFKISGNLRTRIGKLVSGENKSKSSMELLGCDLKFFLKWLEFQFELGMTFDNYGEWHLDHVLPCAKFDLTNLLDQRKCFHWTNYRPAWAEDNIRKGDKILRDMIDEHEIKALNFVDEYGGSLGFHYTLAY